MQQNHTDSSAPVVLAAGGTGGHIFPAEALAERFIARGQRVVLVTDKRFANFTSGALSQIETQTIHAGTPSGKGLKKIRGMAELALGIMQARSVLKKLRPKAVVGFGGYPSFPTMLAAGMMGIPTIIHEQNSVLGRANRILAKKTDHIAISFPDTQMLPKNHNVTVTGNPVRASVKALRDVAYPELVQDSPIRILVTGGSQGASVFSQVVPAAVAMLPENLRSRIRIDQQCRAAEIEQARAAYDKLKIDADLSTFFVDLPARLSACHLVICRSGASTVFELAVAGRPAILVPLPGSMDNHQYHNANAFENAGGGWLMAQDGFTPSALSARLEAFLNAPDGLLKAAVGAREMGLGDAAEKLADLVMAQLQPSAPPLRHKTGLVKGEAA